MLGSRGDNGGAPIPKPLAEKANRAYLAGQGLSQSQKSLPPYEFDSPFDDPSIRKRIGEVIAKAMEHRFPKR
jgi:hypothetical protein